MIGGRWPIASCVAVVMACSREPAPSARLPEPLPPTPVTLLAGDSLFVMHCQSCHGRHALGSDLGPPLVHSVYAPRHHADAAFVLAVRNGVRAHHWTFGVRPTASDIPPYLLDHRRAASGDALQG